LDKKIIKEINNHFFWIKKLLRKLIIIFFG
jgi:hypothetical protein